MLLWIKNMTTNPRIYRIQRHQFDKSLLFVVIFGERSHNNTQGADHHPPASPSYPHRLNLQAWRMEIGDKPEPEAQKSEILAKASFEPGSDLADGDGGQENF